MVCVCVCVSEKERESQWRHIVQRAAVESMMAAVCKHDRGLQEDVVIILVCVRACVCARVCQSLISFLVLILFTYILHNFPQMNQPFLPDPYVTIAKH